MSNPKPTSNDERFPSSSLEATLRIGVVILLVTWCFQIIQPFSIPPYQASSSP